MKYNLKTIELDKIELHPEAYKWTDINENTKFDYFVYHNPDPSLFKVVISWRITLKVNPELVITIAEVEAEQEMIIDATDGIDLTILKNAIASSHLQLQMIFTERVKDTFWETYHFLHFDVSKAANLLKSDLEKPPPPPDILTQTN